MVERIQGIGIVLVLGFMMYMIGFLSHRFRPLLYPGEWSISSHGVLKYFLWMPTAERIYPRAAFIQGLALLYCIVGIIGVLVYGKSIIMEVTSWMMLFFVIWVTIWFIIDTVRFLIHNRKGLQ